MPAPANPSAPPEAGSLREAAAAISAKQTPATANPTPASPEVTSGRMKVISTPVVDVPTPDGEGPDDESDGLDGENRRVSDPDDFEAEDDSTLGAPDPEELDADGLSVRTLPAERLDETFTVKAANGIQKVSLKQLIRSHAHVAEGVAQAQAARQERAAIDQAAGVYLGRLKAVEEVLGKLNGGTERTQEQWQQLYQTSPMEYMRERDVARERQEQFRLVQQERQQVETQRQALRQQQIAEVVQTEANRLVEKFPKLADPQMATKFQNAVVGYLKQSLGATDQELGQILDHRLFVLAYKAFRYDKGKTMQKTVKAKAVDVPAVAALAPGQPRPATAAGQGPVKKALANLQRSGSVNDAAALISARNKQRR